MGGQDRSSGNKLAPQRGRVTGRNDSHCVFRSSFNPLLVCMLRQRSHSLSICNSPHIKPRYIVDAILRPSTMIKMLFMSSLLWQTILNCLIYRRNNNYASNNHSLYISRFGFSRYVALLCIQTSRYIIKAMYLEKTKQLYNLDQRGYI